MAHVHDQHLPFFSVMYDDDSHWRDSAVSCRLGLDVLNFTGIDDRMLSMIRVYAPEI